MSKTADAFGGSLENRARFALEIFRKIKENLSTHLAIGIRFNGQIILRGVFFLRRAGCWPPCLKKPEWIF